MYSSSLQWTRSVFSVHTPPNLRAPSAMSNPLQVSLGGGVAVTTPPLHKNDCPNPDLNLDSRRPKRDFAWHILETATQRGLGRYRVSEHIERLGRILGATHKVVPPIPFFGRSPLSMCSLLSADANLKRTCSFLTRVPAKLMFCALHIRRLFLCYSEQAYHPAFASAMVTCPMVG